MGVRGIFRNDADRCYTPNILGEVWPAQAPHIMQAVAFYVCALVRFGAFLYNICPRHVLIFQDMPHHLLEICNLVAILLLETSNLVATHLMG